MLNLLNQQRKPLMKTKITNMKEEIKVLAKYDRDNAVFYEEISKYKETVNDITSKINRIEHELASVIYDSKKFGSREKIITILKQHHDAIMKINTMLKRHKNEDDE